MYRILLGMISNASLAAFSAALAPTIAPGAGAARATQISAQSRSSASAGSSSVSGPALGGGAAGVPVLRPGQILPRGSLLNLSV